MKSFIAAAVAVFALQAHAERVQMDWKNLVPDGYNEGDFLPIGVPIDVQLKFEGTDLDHDGLLKETELTSLSVAGSGFFDIIPVHDVSSPIGPTPCCSATVVYSIADRKLLGLGIDATNGWHDTGMNMSLTRYTYFFSYAGTFDFTLGEPSVVVAVPEPGSMALLLAGLGAVGLMTASRRRAVARGGAQQYVCAPSS